MQIYSHFYSNDTKPRHVVNVVQLNSALNKSTCGVYEIEYYGGVSGSKGRRTTDCGLTQNNKRLQKKVSSQE